MEYLERLETTVNHREPDRIPLGEWGIDHDHVEAILGRPTYWRNRKAQTLALWEGRRDEVVRGEIRDYIDLVKALDYDLLTVHPSPPAGPPPADPPRPTGEGEWTDSAGRVYRYCPANDSILCMTPPPARDGLSPGEIEERIECAGELDDSRFELLDAVAEAFPDRPLVCRILNVHGIMNQGLGGDETHQLMATATNPDAISRMHELAVEVNRALIERCTRHPNVRILMTGKDYGSSQGCIISPQTIRELYMPTFAEVAALVKEAGRHPFFHCCGKIWDLLEDWLDAGWEGYQSIQGSAGMDMALIKERYGERLTLWTGVQCETLINATPAEVEEEVKRSLEICMPGGGFVFGSTNSVQYGAKTKNYLAAVETLRRYGRY